MLENPSVIVESEIQYFLRKHILRHLANDNIENGSEILAAQLATSIDRFDFAIQIAKLYNCDVIATASPDKLDKCLELGADHAVDHRQDDWSKQVFKITKEIAKRKGQAPGIDLSFDHIGETHFNKQLTLLKYGATLVSCGATTGYDAKIDLSHIFFKGINVLGSTQGTKAELDEGLYWMGQGKIKAAVDSVYTFEQAAEAHTKMLSGKFFGKILLKPEGA